MTAPAAVRHVWRPRGAAAALWNCRAPEVLLSGPAGTGKSRACLEKLHFIALSYAGMRGLILRKTRTSLSSTALVTWREKVAVEALEAGDCVWYGGSAQEPASYRYSNKSIIVVGGLDISTRIMSSEYDIVYVQEAIELAEPEWEAVTTRLRNGKVPFQQLIADTNPDVPTHWLRVRASRGDLLILESRHEDNPLYFDEDGSPTAEGTDYLGKLDRLTGVRKLRLRDGLWCAAEGIVYEEWDASVHVIDRFPIPESWTRWWVVDFGYTNPFVLQRWAEDDDGRLYLYAEQYRTKRLVEDHARDVLAQVAPGGEWVEPKPRAIICDHDAEDRATLEKHLGLSTTAATKTVSDGIQAVQSRMRAAGDGRPRIFILRDSLFQLDEDLKEGKRPVCTADEIPGYIWDGKGKERPVKEDDHGMDCMRYMVADRDLGGRLRIRWF